MKRRTLSEAQINNLLKTQGIDPAKESFNITKALFHSLLRTAYKAGRECDIMHTKAKGD